MIEKNSNVLKFTNSYALERYEARRLKNFNLRAQIHVQSFLKNIFFSKFFQKFQKIFKYFVTFV